jgi:hypothetical protein
MNQLEYYLHIRQYHTRASYDVPTLEAFTWKCYTWLKIACQVKTL